MYTQTVKDLRVENLVRPVGIDYSRPRLSWKMSTQRPGAYQTAYRIETSHWDSGRVESPSSVLVAWGGKPLSSHDIVTWKVSVWDELGDVHLSDVASFEIGLLRVADWKNAQWIGGSLTGSAKSTVPVPAVRKAFTLPQATGIVRARLYATALGVYQAQINGKRVGDIELAPGWTDYDKHVHYQTYDVTELVTPGANAIGALVGDGWYAGHTGWNKRQTYGLRPVFKCVLHIELDNGETVTITTNRSWSVAYGTVVESDMMMGESQDARLYLGSWTSGGYIEDPRWSRAVQMVPIKQPKLVAQNSPPIRVTQILTPHSVYKNETTWIYDMGINAVGKIRFTCTASIGQVLTFRYAEVLAGGPSASDGPIYTDNLRTARNTDIYVCSGNPEGEVFETFFTFHGFRFVEVSGLTSMPDIDAMETLVMHSDCKPTMMFECSHAFVNQLIANVDWGMRGNWLDVPTDCPQRDERLGWTGDAQAFVRTAAFHREVGPFFHKWARDLRDAQSERGSFPSVAPNKGHANDDGGPAWSDAGVICPWTIALAYGDTKILEDNFASMCSFVDWLDTSSPGGIRCASSTGLDWKSQDGNHCYGDWLALDGSGETVGGTPFDLIGTAFFAYSADLLSRSAKLIGRHSAASKYSKMFTRVREAFQNRFILPSGLIACATQTAYTLSLHFGLTQPERVSAQVNALVADIRAHGTKTTTGFAGSPFLPHVLSANGQTDLMYELLLQEECPSYLYAVTLGATTIWERWDAWTKEHGFQDIGMNSFNHYAYGAVAAWIYQTMAGLDVDENAIGYRHALLKPQPPSNGCIKRCAATLETPYGTLSSHWEIHDHTFKWNVIIPPCTSATARIPSKSHNEVIVQLGPGPHYFTSDWNT